MTTTNNDFCMIETQIDDDSGQVITRDRIERFTSYAKARRACNQREDENIAANQDDLLVVLAVRCGSMQCEYICNEGNHPARVRGGKPALAGQGQGD
jgi:hypothetical protein